MATRRQAPELGYDPADLVPGVPTLYVSLNGRGWELRCDGVLLSTHPTRDEALDAAYEQCDREFGNILAEGSTGRFVFQMEQDPVLLKLFRDLDRARGMTS
jgi:hypothetical protein